MVGDDGQALDSYPDQQGGDQHDGQTDTHAATNGELLQQEEHRPSQQEGCERAGGLTGAMQVVIEKGQWQYKGEAILWVLVGAEQYSQGQRESQSQVKCWLVRGPMPPGPESQNAHCSCYQRPHAHRLDQEGSFSPPQENKCPLEIMHRLRIDAEMVKVTARHVQTVEVVKPDGGAQKGRNRPEDQYSDRARTGQRPPTAPCQNDQGRKDGGLQFHCRQYQPDPGTGIFPLPKRQVELYQAPKNEKGKATMHELQEERGECQKCAEQRPAFCGVPPGTYGPQPLDHPGQDDDLQGSPAPECQAQRQQGERSHHQSKVGRVVEGENAIVEHPPRPQDSLLDAGLEVQVVEIGAQSLANDGTSGVEGSEVGLPEKVGCRDFDDQAHVFQCDAQVESSKPAR